MVDIIPTSQSDIGEVRDQLTLDRADGKYLNVVAANLGLQRPPFGFSDATWRALVRVIALQYKQVTTKFEAVLEIILGPKVTQCSALVEAALTGAKHAVLVDTTHLPQVGTMVLDEGLAAEETVEYTFIDRYSNVVYFATPLVNNHVPVNAVWESGVISDVAPAASFLNVYDASGFPTPAAPYTICIGRGTPAEFAGPLTSLDLDARKLGISFPPLGATGASSVAGTQVVMAAIPSQVNVHYLTLLEVDGLKIEGGWLQSNGMSTTYTATAGSTTSVTVAGPVTAHRYGGFWIRFNGDVTAALTNKVAYVEDNTSTVFTFSNTLGAAPAAGDKFNVLNNFQYLRVSAEDNSVLTARELPDRLQYPASSQFSVMQPTATVAIAQVQVKGAAWDVFQSDPRHVEILLPVEFLTNDLRSASYIRNTGMSGTATTNAIRNFGDTDVSFAAATGLPLVGVAEHVAAATRYAYYNPHAWLTADAPVGSTTLQVTDTSQFLPTGTVRIFGTFTAVYSVLDATTLSVAPTGTAARKGSLVQDDFRIRLSKGLLSGVVAAQVFNFYTNYDLGSLWSVADVWPGPYVWDLSAAAHKKQTTPGNSATTYLSGPTKLAVERLIGATVFELDDASAFPTAVPYDLLVGENSGNVETLAVQQLSLCSRTYEVTTADVNIGDVAVTLTDLSGPVAPANQFPNGGPYRVLIDPFTATSEVLEVISTSGGNTLNLTTPATAFHATGARVVLMADLVRVSPAAGDDHAGMVAYSNRFGFYPAVTQTPDTARPLYTQLTLALGGTDFNAAADTALINFGSDKTPVTSTLAASVSPGAGSLTLVDSSMFPTTGYPYVVHLDVGSGPILEERLHVTNNNTGTGVLTLSHSTVFSHASGRRVEFRPGNEEAVSYTSRVGAILNFSPYLVVENTHFASEFVAPSVGTGYPRKTGYDFPLRLPVTVEDRIRFVVDLIRAAGVEVTFISKR